MALQASRLRLRDDGVGTRKRLHKVGTQWLGSEVQQLRFRIAERHEANLVDAVDSHRLLDDVRATARHRPRPPARPALPHGVDGERRSAG
jgi:hypothetical protein